LLPYVLEFNMPAILDKLSALVDILIPEARSRTAEEKAALFIEKTKNLLKIFKIPKLKELSIPQENFQQLAEDALEVAVPIENNPRPINAENIVEIYKKAY
jgi:alcohol dehydrogenase